MKQIHHLFTLLLFLTLPVFLVAQNNALKGTWKMTRAKWGDAKAHKPIEQEVYKIYTDEHFFFLYYDKEKFSGAGGGTYTTTNKTFTETLAYYSWDSSAVGTQQSFQWIIEGDVLHQTGFLKGTATYDDYVIDEYYERVEDDFTENPSNDLVGVWLYKDGKGDTHDYRITNNIKSYKVITPKYFYIAFINQDTGAFDGAGFGTYTYEKGKYSETIHAFSFDQSAVGKTFDFEVAITDHQVIQKGKMDTDNYKDFSVMERYVRVK